MPGMTEWPARSRRSAPGRDLDLARRAYALDPVAADDDGLPLERGTPGAVEEEHVLERHDRSRDAQVGPDLFRSARRGPARPPALRRSSRIAAAASIRTPSRTPLRTSLAHRALLVSNRDLDQRRSRPSGPERPAPDRKPIPRSQESHRARCSEPRSFSAACWPSSLPSRHRIGGSRSREAPSSTARGPFTRTRRCSCGATAWSGSAPRDRWRSPPGRSASMRRASSSRRASSTSTSTILPGPHASIDGTGTDANPELPLLFLANGVTTQREMGQWISDNEDVARLGAGSGTSDPAPPLFRPHPGRA